MKKSEATQYEHGVVSFAQMVRNLSAEYGVYDIPQMAELMSMPVETAQRMLNPLKQKAKEPSVWFQKMFLELYKQKLETHSHAA